MFNHRKNHGTWEIRPTREKPPEWVRLVPKYLENPHKRSVKEREREALGTREMWLLNAAGELDKRVFSRAGYPIPPIKVTVGFPSTKGVSEKDRAMGECWARFASDDGINQIFISPTVTSSDHFVDILAHELVHAVDDCKSGHGGMFQTICKAVGLIRGKPTSACAGGKLMSIIAQICCDLGPFPHAALHPAIKQRMQQTRRKYKIECPACGYTCRTTAKWAEFGMPTCPCETKMTATWGVEEHSSSQPTMN